MRIAVLSGKGGAGKTFVSVNLAVAAGQSTYIDCDVEEPNGRLFLMPAEVETETVYQSQPAFDKEKCTGCRKCVEFCCFNALVLVKKKPMLFEEVCHSCGGCALVCPEGAVSDAQRPVGVVETGQHGGVHVVTGVLNVGESSAIPVEKRAMEVGFARGGTVVIDCPPGSACSVMESVAEADYCVLVAEPTAFGLHNLQMVYELVSLLGKPRGVVINKADGEYAPLEQFCADSGTPVLCRIPYSGELARLTAAGEIAAEQYPELRQLFEGLLRNIERQVGP